MIKRYKKMLTGLIVAAVIAVLAYFGVLVYQNTQVKKQNAEAMKRVVFSFDPMDITDMDITNSTGNFTFKLTSNGWEMTSGQKFKLSADRIVDVSTTMAELVATKILTEELPDDLGAYGLANPMRITFKFNDGSEHTAEIGSKVPGDSAYYLRADHGDTIYIVSSDDAETMSVEVADIKDRFLFDTSGTSDITRLKYTDHGSVIIDISRESYRDDWKIAAPFSDFTVNDAGVTAITSVIIRAECSTFVDEDLTDSSKFGFNNPSYQLEIATAEQNATVIFGNYYDEKEQYIYAYNRALDQIYIFETASLGFVGSRTEDVLLDRLRQESFENISKFEMNLFGTKVNIDFNYVVENGKTSSYSVNGKSVDREDEKVLEVFNNLVNAVTGAAFDEVLNDSFSPLHLEPEVKIVYRLKEGDDYTLELYTYEEDNSLLRVVENGKYTGTLMKRTAIENGALLYYKDLMDVMG